MNIKKLCNLAIATFIIIFSMSGCKNNSDQDVSVFYMIDKEVSDSTGNSISILYGDDISSMDLVFNKDTLHLIQEKVDNGLSYRNNTYRYVELKDKIYIFKNGKTVFESIKKDNLNKK